MAARDLPFSSQIDDWVRRTEQRMTAVFRESTQRVGSIAQQYISGELVNVDTGFLRASVRASLSEMPKIESKGPAEGASYSDSFGDVVLVIAGAEVGQTIYIGWTANYAPYVHYGTSKMGPRPWVYLAALQWGRVVSQVTEEAKARASR